MPGSDVSDSSHGDAADAAHAEPAPLLTRLATPRADETAALTAALELAAGLLGATAAAVLRRRAIAGDPPSGAGEAEVLAVVPEVDLAGSPPAWLSIAADHLPRDAPPRPDNSPQILGPDENGRLLALVPLGPIGAPGVSAVFLAEPGDDAGRLARRAALAPGVIALHRYPLEAEADRAASRRVSRAVDLAAAADAHARFGPAAIALVNAAAATFEADRVAFGLCEGIDPLAEPVGWAPGAVRVLALSHADSADRRTRLTADLAAAMEECVDQGGPTRWPSDPAEPIVTRDARALAEAHGPSAVLVVPVAVQGVSVGALTVERATDRPLADDEALGLSLAVSIAGPRLLDLHARSRWPGLRAWRAARRSAAWALGPRHTGGKLLAVAALAAVVLLSTVPVTRHASGDAAVVAEQRRVVSAPFAGYVIASDARVGDAVTGGRTVLAELDASELRLRLAEADSARIAAETRAAAERTAGRVGPARIADAEADEQRAVASLLRAQIARAAIVAPITGVIAEGELDRVLGAPVNRGDPLFEIIPPGSLIAEASIPERDAARLRTGQRATVATASRPGQRLPAVVARIAPAARLDQARNVFTVTLEFAGEPPPWLRPGMEGAARIDVGRTTIIGRWLGDAADIVRLRLWW